VYVVSVRDNTKVPSEPLKILVGQNLTIECNSTSETTWYSESLTSTHWSPYNNLHIDSVTLDHTGYYYCYGHYYTEARNFLARAEVKVYGKH